MKSEDRSEIYRFPVNLENHFDPRVVAFNWIEEDKRVLDVGCACGDFGDALKKEKKCIVYGMEYDLRSIEIAKELGSYEEIYQLDLNDIAVRKYGQLAGSFDYIFFGDVLEHLMWPERVLEAFKFFLKKNGAFIVSLPNVAHASIKAGLLNDEFMYTETGLLDKTHVKLFTARSIVSFLEKLRLEATDVVFSPLDIYGWHSHDPFSALPEMIQQYIFADPHSFVSQYVMKLKNTAEDIEDVRVNNTKKLGLSSEGVPEYLLEVQKARMKSIDIELLRDTIRHRDEDIVSLNESIRHRDKDIVSLNESIRIRNEQIEGITQRLREKERELAGVVNTLRWKIPNFLYKKIKSMFNLKS